MMADFKCATLRHEPGDLPIRILPPPHLYDQFTVRIQARTRLSVRKVLQEAPKLIFSEHQESTF
jgi:hypothetical protein